MGRTVRKPFAFSNGMSIPVGTVITVASEATHMDEENYAHAREFQPLRYYEEAARGEVPSQRPTTSTSPEFCEFHWPPCLGYSSSLHTFP
jgi:cytochrome P450